MKDVPQHREYMFLITENAKNATIFIQMDDSSFKYGGFSLCSSSAENRKNENHANKKLCHKPFGMGILQ